MRAHACILLGAAALAAAASDVHELKADTFKPFIEKNDLVLAEFFAPWCGHCKALAPEYEEAATTLKEKNIQLAKIDCTEEAQLCQDHGVEGYPTLKVFRKGHHEKPNTYSGQRKADAIVSYMTKQQLPSVSVVDSKTIEDFKKQDKVVLVAYFAADDKTTNATYTSVADGLRDDFLFGATNDASLAEADGVKQPGLVLYKSFDEGKNVYSGKFDPEAITAFITEASMPLIGDVGPDTYSKYMSAGLPLAYIFAEEESERKSLSDELKTIAKKFKGKVSFATIDAKAYGQHASNLNLEVGKWPAFAIQEINKNQKFPYSQDEKITVEAIEKFVTDFTSGKIEPSIKSEPIPETNDGPVTVVVAKNYEEIIMDDKKDVLIEFYAPWCGHCKSLAPKYEELGTMFSKYSDKVTIAKVDATANDVPDEVQGFPTIRLYPAGKKKDAVEYDGSRTLEDLANFVRDNGSHKVDGLAGYKPAKSAAADGEDEDDVAKATGDMPQQAMAASENAEEATGGAKGAAKKVASKASEAAEAVASGLLDDEGGAADHDEL